MKTPEDEAFDELAAKQGHWNGGFMAKRTMAADKLRDCVHGSLARSCQICDLAVEVEELKAALAQPAQEPWVSLTPEQVQECADNSYYHSAWSSEVDLALFAQNLDAALRKANT